MIGAIMEDINYNEKLRLEIDKITKDIEQLKKNIKGLNKTLGEVEF